MWTQVLALHLLSGILMESLGGNAWVSWESSLPLRAARSYPEGHPGPSAAAAFEEVSHNMS